MQPVGAMTFVSLGSNLGDRQAMIEAALAQLGEMPETTVLAVSSLYDTAPVGETAQPRFLNCVVHLDSRLTPEQLLWHCMLIEQRLGRVRTRRWAPRPIDVDILLCGDQIIEEDGLSVPHVEMLHRAFVLVPLCELAPDVVHPVTGQTVLEHLRGLDPQAEVDVVQQGRVTL